MTPYEIEGIPYRFIRLYAGENGPLFETGGAGAAARRAVKRLDRVDPKDEAVLARVLAGIEQSRGLAHLALVPPDEFVVAERVYLVSDFIDGSNLREYFLNQTSFERSSAEWTAEVGRVFGELCGVLQLLHGKGIAHGNLAPPNVFLTEWGELKLTDAAVVMNPWRAKPDDSPEEIARHSSHVFYLAGDILRGAEPNPAGDLYAVGAMLYELLAGHPPFYENRTAGAVAAKLAGTAVPQLGEAPGPEAEALEEIALRLLSPSRERTYADAAELKTAFERVRVAAAAAGASRLEAEASREVGRRVFTRALGKGTLESAGVKGRDPELAALGAALNRVLEGGFAGVLLAGETGIGKTRLVAETARHARSKEIGCVEAAAGGGAEAGATSPYGLWRGFLEAVACEITSLPSSERASVFPPACDVLTLLCPALAECCGRTVAAEAFPPLDNPETRHKVLQAMSVLFSALARRRPMLLLADHVERADALSLEVLLHVATQAAREPGLGSGFVLAVGTDDARGREAADKLAEVAGMGRLDLRPISRQAVTAMAAAMMGTTDAPAELGELLFRHSQGIPGWVAETVRALKTEGVLTETAPGLWGLNAAAFRERAARRAAGGAAAAPVGEMARRLQERMAALTPEAGRLVAAAAVNGDALTFENLRLLSGIEDEDELLDAIEEALRLEFLQKAGTDRYRITPGPIRAAVMDGMEEQARCRMHRQAAALIEQGPEGETDDGILAAADHWHEGRFADRASAYALKAARIHRKKFQLDDAEAMIKRAIEWTRPADAMRGGGAAEGGVEDRRDASGAETGGADRSSTFTEALAEMGSLLNQRARYAEGLAVYEELLSFARRRDDSRTVVQALNGMGESLRFKGEPQRAISVLRRSLEISTALEFAEPAARARMMLGSLYANQGDHDKAILELTAAQEDFVNLGKEMEVADLAVEIGRSYRKREEIDRALEHFRNAADVYARNDSRGRLSVTLVNIGLCLAQQGKLDEAMRELEKARFIKEEVGDRKGLATCLTNLAGIYFQLGRISQALEYNTRALRLHEETGDTFRQAVALVNIGRIRITLGQQKAAVLALEKALAISESSGFPIQRAEALERLSYVYSNLDRQKALQQAEVVLQIGIASRNRPLEAWGLLRMSYLLTPTAARATAHKAAGIAKDLDLPVLTAGVLAAEGEAAAQCGDLDAALVLYRNALERLRRVLEPEAPAARVRFLTDREYRVIVKRAWGLECLSDRKREPQDVLKGILDEHLGLSLLESELLRVVMQ